MVQAREGTEHQGEFCTLQGREAAGIFVKYACGECVDPNCEADHGQHHELPRLWISNLVTTLREGVKKM